MKKLVSTLLFLALATLPAAASASTLNVKTFNPGADAIFAVTSTLVYGDRDAVLVDAQFQKKYAEEVVAIVKASGKNLKYIFISHSDPDYYFGLDTIKKAFPRAKILSTAQTAYLISASKDAKIAVWKDKMGTDAPDKLHVPEAVTSDTLTIDGEAIKIRQNKDDTGRSYLWIPSLKTVLGGIPVAADGHLWMADTTTVQGIDLWIKCIEDMQSLQPEKVIPGHYIKSDMSPSLLNFIKKYLTDYRMAVTSHTTSAGIVADMEKKYPNLSGKESLKFGAKVFTGEVPWRVTSPYPPIGKTAEVNFGGTVFELRFSDNRIMAFEGTAGESKGVKDVVEYTAIEVCKNVFMVYWHEPRLGSNVVHVQDWNTGTVYTNISAKDSSFIHMKGTIKIK